MPGGGISSVRLRKAIFAAMETGRFATRTGLHSTNQFTLLGPSHDCTDRQSSIYPSCATVVASKLDSNLSRMFGVVHVSRRAECCGLSLG
jgi:hypothetical protein